MAGVLKHSEVPFQEDVVSVRKFTGFVWRKGQFMEKKIYGFQKIISDFVRMWPKTIW